MSKINNFKLRVSAFALALVLGGSGCAKENNVDKKQSNNSKTTTNQTFDLPYDLKKDGITSKEVIIENDEKLVTFDVVEPTKSESEEETITNPTEPNPVGSDPEPEITDKKDESKITDEAKTTNEIETVKPKSSFDEYAKTYGLDDTEIDAISKTMNNKIEIVKSDSDKSLIAANYIITLNKAIDKLCNAYDPAKEIFNPSKANLAGNEDTKIISDYIDVIENFSKNPTNDNLSNVMLLFRRFIFLDASEKNLDPGQVNFTIVYSSNMIYTIVEKNKLRLSTDDKNDINHHKTLGFIYGYSDGQIDCDKNKQLIK